MNEQTKALIFGVLILILAVSACTSADPPLAPTVTQTVNLQTRLAQITPSDTPTPIPSYTPDPNATPIPKESATPTPVPTYLPGTENSLFPIPNQNAYFHTVLPTAIPTPSALINNYQLKPWTAEDAVGLVQIADRYAYQAGVVIRSADSYYPSWQPLVKLSANEGLYRFPQMRLAEELKWKAAVSSMFGYQNKDIPTNWIIKKIAEALNSSQTDLDSLDEYLRPKGLSATFEPVENLKGSGNDGYLLVIAPSYAEKNRLDLVIVITEENGKYHLEYLILPEFYTDGLSLAYEFLRDQDEDEIPEIIVFDNDKIRILEWQDGEFYDHSRGEMYWTSGTPGFEFFEFDPKNYPDYDLVSSNEYGLAPAILWKWEEGAYQAKAETPFCPFYKFLDQEADYPEQLLLLEEILERWDEVQCSGVWEVEDEDRDIWQLNLGFAYLSADVEKGMDIINGVAYSGETDDQTALVAQTFLDHFSGEWSRLIPGCNAVNDLFEGPNYFRKHTAYFCQDSIILDYLIMAYSDRSLPQFLAYLDSAGGFDNEILNVNGKMVGLVKGNWFIYEQAEKLVRLNENGAIYNLKNLKVTAVLLPGKDQPVYQIFSDGSFVLLDFDLESDPPSVTSLLDIYSITDLDTTIINGDFYYYGINLDPYHQDDVCSFYSFVEPFGYRWESDQQDFSQVDVFASLLFDAENYDSAISILYQYVNLTKPLYQLTKQRELECMEGKHGWSESELVYSRLLYLLGLAYELNGDEALAVQTYYRLWQEAPDSGYALMARAKLEEVGP